MADASTAQSLPSQQNPPERGLRFSNLRGVRWRVDLGVLPSSPTSSVEDFRRAAADSRRRYACVRHQLLVDVDGNESPSLVMDNPLSQNPDSLWGRFFRNTELEKLVETDLSRLYPEHGSFSQTPTCQAMLRRVLLLWCIRHPQYGYRQGMHELLAPLLFVLHLDVQHLSELRKKYEDHFIDKLDGISFLGSDMVSNYRFTKSTQWDDLIDEENGLQGGAIKQRGLDDLDPETRDIISLSDAYGPEGELGMLLSKRYMEHDAYCTFDALMNGGYGVVSMGEFFSLSPATGSHTGVSPVIEASSAMNHLLSVVDSSLHSHLDALGVQPQYFALRWLRVLFGREFSLESLLLIWDEIFSSPNDTCHPGAEKDHSHFKILDSACGVFILAVSISMILHLRSSLLATRMQLHVCRSCSIFQRT